MTKTLLKFGLCSMLTLFVCMDSIHAQRVSPDVERLVAIQNDTAEYFFTSYQIPIITGPTANLGSGRIELSLISGFEYVLRYYSTSTISTDGWASDLRTYPSQGDNIYTVKRVRMITQQSIVDAHLDYLRIPLGTDSIDIDILSNDESTNNDLLVERITIVNDGTAEVVDTTQLLRFWPAADYEGLARIQYLVCDDNGTCDLGGVSVYIYNPTDTLRSDTIEVVAVNTGEITIPLPWEGFDFVDLPDDGMSSIDTVDWLVSYSANPDFAGQDTLQVSDGEGFVRTVLVEVLSVPEENGFVIEDVFYPAPDRVAILDVYRNDFYQVLQMDTFTQPNQGTVIPSSLGSFFYIPPAGFVGSTKFEYRVCNSTVCETADVHLFVGKQEPREDIEHVISMARQDQRRIIDIQNSMDFYSIRVVEQPEHGYAAVNSFFYDNCSPGFNFLNNVLTYTVASPIPSGFIGLDTFTVAYCLQDLSDCDTVDIIMDMYDDPQVFCCNTDCVWPGDANADGWVDMSDLLQLGMFIGEEGTSRVAPDPSIWKGQRVTDWNVTGSGANAKHADTDGDGVITYLDSIAIKTNYNSVNNLVANKAHLLETIPVDMGHDNVPRDSGDLVVMEVVLGNQFKPALDIYGFSFTIDYPAEHVDSSSTVLDFPEHTWLVEGTPKLSMEIEPVKGFVDGGVTRLDKIAASGYGLVASFNFIIVDDLDGIRDVNGYVDVPIKLKNIVGSRIDGSNFALPDVQTTIRLNRRPNREAPEVSDVYVFPNPAVNEMTIHLNGQNSLSSYELYDFSGRLIQSGPVTGKRDRMILTQSLEGMYVLRLQTKNGPVSKKIQFVQQ